MTDQKPTKELLEAKLQEADAEINRLEAKLREQEAGSEIRQNLNQRIEDVRTRYSELKGRATTLKQKTSSSVDELEQGTRAAWNNLTDAIKRATREFK